VLRGPEGKGTVGAEFETPEALRGREMGRVSPSPVGLGSVVSSPGGVRDGNPADRKQILVHFELKKQIW